MKTLIVIDSVGVEESFVEKLKKFLSIKYSKSIEENYKRIAITIKRRQVCNSTSLEGLIGSHILWLLLRTELVNRAEIFERPGRCIRKCFDHKEGQTPLLAKEGSNRCCTGHFVVSFSLSLSLLSPLSFMIRFYLSSNPKVWFTMVPYAVCGLRIVVRPTLLVPPSVSGSFFPSSRRETRDERIKSRRRERGGWEMKNRCCLLPSFLWNRFSGSPLHRDEMSILQRISIQRPFRSVTDLSP